MPCGNAMRHSSSTNGDPPIHCGNAMVNRSSGETETLQPLREGDGGTLEVRIVRRVRRFLIRRINPC